MPQTHKRRLGISFNVRTAAEMVGRSEKLIRDAEADGRLPEPSKNEETGRRRNGYSLAQSKSYARRLWYAPCPLC